MSITTIREPERRQIDLMRREWVSWPHFIKNGVSDLVAWRKVIYPIVSVRGSGRTLWSWYRSAGDFGVFWYPCHLDPRLSMPFAVSREAT